MKGDVTMSDTKETIAAAKEGFEAAFAEKNFYARQTQDDTQLNAIIDFLPVRPGMKILDLGAGTGYLTFAIAKSFPDVTIVGLDIVEKALENDRRRAADEKLDNISFCVYDGVNFPFADKSFDMVVSRYALHHFPEIRASLSEISRVLTDEGYLFICDPTPNDIDKDGFIDEYMQVKPDGHIRFYSAEEWKELCRESGLFPADSFKSSIRFPRKMEQAYLDIMRKYDRDVVESYDMKIIDKDVWVTEWVNNMLFCK
ncbi:MAG: methyltransferase domain-containing protein [Ruminococcus albus]|jgi:ubiquinone/menaquinone biosynthesis C-methylase UbiE|nr:methyltransferase domain-containing protein [Ruminococcus albus]